MPLVNQKIEEPVWDFGEEVAEVCRRFEVSAEEAEGAFLRSYRHYRNLDAPEAKAADKARELVEIALEAAPRYGFELLPMVEFILFSTLHRTPRCKQFISSSDLR